jgi:PAS domain S-box-containing protein
MASGTRAHRILIIDDSPEDRELYHRLIARGSEQDYLFWETGSGEEGLQLYHSEHPDCVVLDYNLPDLNGLEFLARLQLERGPEPVPVIMLTGQGNETVAVQALKIGAQDYLIKNHAARELKDTVQAVLTRATLRRRIEEERRSLDRSIEALRESEQRYWLSAARALRESEERYRLLVQGVVDYAIVMLDPGGQIVSWNAGAERLLGYGAGEIIGKHFSCFYPPEGVQRGDPRRELRVASDTGRYMEEGWRVRKDGSRFFAHVTVSGLRDESGSLWGFAKVIRAIAD